MTVDQGTRDVAEVLVYLRKPSDDDQRVKRALDAEQAAQRRACRVPSSGDLADWPADLWEALQRRVARNLALRGMPLAVLQGDAETGATVLPGTDPEVRRLESSWRRLVIG